MRAILLLSLVLFLFPLVAAEPEFPLTEDSKPQANIPKGELIKDSYTAKSGSVFPGTVRDYTLYLPSGFDKTKPAPFMVFQDGVIYQAPVVFDNLIAKREIPPLVAVFVKPGVVPAANENALPRFNRSYEYDSISDTYARFLIDELLPAIEQKHGIQLSTDPNDAGISGNSSGGIAAFMVAWHRHDRFRRVFTGVGTYVGIHGGDQLPVLVRKFEPKPIKIFLQSGTGDNNLYCGDWWMANQMMERSLTWAGYDVNHAWGEGGHNQKHASQIFPDVLRWLWKGWPENKEVKANVRGESKWRGYEIIGNESGWKEIATNKTNSIRRLGADREGAVYFSLESQATLGRITLDGASTITPVSLVVRSMATRRDGSILLTGDNPSHVSERGKAVSLQNGSESAIASERIANAEGIAISADDHIFVTHQFSISHHDGFGKEVGDGLDSRPHKIWFENAVLSPDQTLLYLSEREGTHVYSSQIRQDGGFQLPQKFFELQQDSVGKIGVAGLCVDTDGRLYVATSLGIQVCDQAGRVNFIIPTPDVPYDVCFGGKDLSELFIACGDKIYKRATTVRGVVSGQMAPIKPAPPKL